MRANWSEMADFFATLFSLDTEEAYGLRHAPVARLVAELPYLANSANPQRTAYAHLATLLVAKQAPQVFGHDSNDTLRSRLEPITHFAGGDPAIIERGLLLLELAALSDHRADVEYDSLLGKYNPLSASEVDYAAERDRLVAAIERIPCPEMDEILSVDGAIRLGYWCCTAPEEQSGESAAPAVTGAVHAG